MCTASVVETPPPLVDPLLLRPAKRRPPDVEVEMDDEIVVVASSSSVVDAAVELTDARVAASDSGIVTRASCEPPLRSSCYEMFCLGFNFQ